MIRQLNVWQLQDEQPVLKIAAKAAHEVLVEYYKKSIETRHSFVTTICDPRFMPCLLSSGFDSLYCLGTAPAHVARSNALGSLNTR